jgi:nitrite reductase/ring-hydroxylating ferredoxin subunit
MSPEENETLCRVGRGTPMGELLRRYWLPACLSSDVDGADADPFPVRLLGEDYVAFRDSSGQVGVLDEHCPHRRASLLLGRVEQGGIQCLYHGWRFDVKGRVLELPNCDDARVQARYKANAYPVAEAGGLVWVYLGPAGQQPAFPLHPWMDVAPSHRYTRVLASHANFVQVTEGLLDSSHLGVLHQDALPKSDGSNKYAHPGKTDSFAQLTSLRAPRIEVQESSFGLYYAALRETADADGSAVEARISAFVAPFTVYVPFDKGGAALLLVPVDDDHTHMYNIQWDPDRPIAQEPFRSQLDKAGGTLAETAERWGFSRATHGRAGTASKANRWLQDRAAMRRGESFSGLPVFIAEDAAMTSSMGPISDRRELLVPADLAIVRMRKFMLAAARSVAQGAAPPGYAPGRSPGDVRAKAMRIRNGVDWRSLLAQAEAVAA